MSRYVNIDKVLKCLRLNHKDVIYIDKNECAKRIKALPTIDIEPKRGEWIDDGFAHRCSECGKQGVGIEYFNFCPNCGADMRGKDDGCNGIT